MARYAFRFISGKYQGGEFPIPEEGELLIGRSSELDLVLVEDMVSRKHAKLTIGADGLVITDLGSTNGTFVNGEKVRRHTLKRNDRILVGTSILKVIDSAEMTINRDASAAKEMMEELGSRQTDATMSGELEEVPLPDLLQLFATNKKAGVLTITGDNRGKVYIKNGQIQFAVVAGEVQMKPMKALCRMIAWEKGHFTMEPYDEAATFSETFTDSTESVLMESLRQHDEMKKLLSELPAGDSPLALCVPMTPRLSDLDKNHLDVLQLAVNFGNVTSIIDKFEGTDFAAVTGLHKLLREGYLEVHQSE